MHEWELPLIKALQSIRTQSSDQFFLFINMFDTFLPYLLILAAVWHLKDRRKGFHLACLQSIGPFLYTNLKHLFAEPRPYQLMPNLEILGTSGYGFPSGAALSSMITLGFIGFFLHPGKLLLRGVTILLILLVGLTRVYLGAHFPSDVIGGWLLGLTTLLCYGGFLIYVEEKNSLLTKSILIFIGITSVATFLWIHFSIELMIMVPFFIGAAVGYIFLKPKNSKNSFISLMIALIGIVSLYTIFYIVQHTSMNSIQKIAVVLPGSFLIGLWLGLSEKIAMYFKKMAVKN